MLWGGRACCHVTMLRSQPPAAVQAEAAALRTAVRQIVPARTDTNLLIGSWNLRGFSDVTQSWDPPPNATPRRDWRAITLIATVVSAFDVVAVQEVRRDTTALRTLTAALGQDWQFVCSDVTEGQAGNAERLTFLYDSTRVRPSGLVGEIVLPPQAATAAAQFARTPYAASFTRNAVEFILTTVHIIWDAPASRIPEITAFATWMHDWAIRANDWNSNLLALGDFNLEGPGTPLYRAFVSTGLFPPGELSTLPRTIFDTPNKRHYYDQIAWFSDVDATGQVHNLLHGMTYTGRAGNIDFLPYIYAGMSKAGISWRISDHYPLWVEFELPPAHPT
jgi:endonuclease/exonuclease/phosphatase family metal-dependent hydrolase